jgi:NAD-dependent dihydropyrimidine dehydrogenase PreA subunit
VRGRPRCSAGWRLAPSSAALPGVAPVTASLIVGSGPAAAGVALALSHHRDEQITVIDIGTRLSADKQLVMKRLAALPPSEWPADQVNLIRSQTVRKDHHALPEKRSYGSDYPFRDVGQLQGLHAAGRTNRSVISGAYGGFSTVWGAQVMPLTEEMFAEWPVTFEQMTPHYRAILDHIPFAAEKDDLAEMFPFLGQPSPLPPLHPRTQMVLDAYQRHRDRLRALGITLGHARLALKSDQCVLCGLCLTGCPHSLIYSAAQTFDALVEQGRVKYIGGLIAYRLSESGDRARVEAWDTDNNSTHTFEADRVYVACGGFGSTRLVLGSLRHYDRAVEVQESVQFVLPALSAKRTPGPDAVKSFTLNQFNMIVSVNGSGRDLAQIHFYSSDPSYRDALPAPLRLRVARPAANEILRHATLGLGYLPSWASPRLRVVARQPQGSTLLPELEIGPESAATGRMPMLKQVVRRMLRAAPYLDLLPVTAMQYVSASAKSYHFGGSFPHAQSGLPSSLSTDRLGRMRSWQRIHIVDGSVLPAIPATTFTLTVMANAHRIAAESVILGGR